MDNQSINYEAWPFKLIDIALRAVDLNDVVSTQVKAGNYNEFNNIDVGSRLASVPVGGWGIFRNSRDEIRYLFKSFLGIIILEPYCGGVCDVFGSQRVRDVVTLSGALMECNRTNDALRMIDEMERLPFESKIRTYVSSTLSMLSNTIIINVPIANDGLEAMEEEIVKEMMSLGDDVLSRYTLHVLMNSDSSKVTIEEVEDKKSPGYYTRTHSWQLHHML